MIIEATLIYQVLTLSSYVIAENVLQITEKQFHLRGTAFFIEWQKRKKLFLA